MIKKRKLINIRENPIILFNKWFKLAEQNEINDPNAMNLATIDKSLKPSSRIVLLKSYDDKGFIFYTNLESKKGNSIKNNPFVAINFYWKSIRRQIRIEGKVSIVENLLAEEYFETRPIGSKVGAWASKQSKILKNRDELKKRVNFFEKKFLNKKISKPLNWSGYRISPNLYEFWQEMPFRLHDRIEFKKNGKKWKGKRLYP